MVNISALLETFLYLITSSLLYPVLLLLSLSAVLILVCVGSFFAELLERWRLLKYASEQLPDIIVNNQGHRIFSHHARTYIACLRNMLNNGASDEFAVEALFHEYTRNLLKTLDHLKILLKLGPALGLMGTLIPMGTGLAVVSQGDLSKISADLSVAFTTTVIGLAVGMTAFVLLAIKKRWMEEDLLHIELATELLVVKHAERR
ncbi:biopolymer transport protein-like protein [Candidatus Moduliflexus flocculans]|uniref:Biopolymer transport protein-like protein n=1 Tax=Candidatus Moduliflexus flocculans TaxID=1499966 RepID=A0A081BME5_9BACT|nr:biopolymer transport protein-like protein [Candidatus Moduliflexus flocculans]